MKTQKKSKKTDTRTKIIDAAFLAMQKLPVHEVTLTLVSKSAGISHPLMIYHFPVMSSLYQEVCQKVIDEIREFSGQKVNNISSPILRLKSHALAITEWCSNNRSKGVILAHFFYLATLDARLRADLTLSRVEGDIRVKALLQACVESGDLQGLSEKGNLEELSLLITNWMVGSALMLLYRDDITLKMLEKQFEALIQPHLKQKK